METTLVRQVDDLTGRGDVKDAAKGARRLGAGVVPAVSRDQVGEDQRADAGRLARGHIRSLERLGYKVTLEHVDPDTGELAAKAS